MEGVVRFHVEHRREELAAATLDDSTRRLLGWRAVLRELGLLGFDGQRYGGYAWGNLSLRHGTMEAPRGHRRFLVTGTQTSGLATIGLPELALVERYDCTANRVWSRGLARPSSEALSHGAAYDACADVAAVLHVHSPRIWKAAGRLALPVTVPAAANGTVEMAAEVARLVESAAAARPSLPGVLVMAGHTDGVLAWGGSPDAAALALLSTLAAASSAQPPGLG